MFSKMAVRNTMAAALRIHPIALTVIVAVSTFAHGEQIALTTPGAGSVTIPTGCSLCGAHV